MDFLSVIFELEEELERGGEEIAPFVYVGVDVYHEIRKEMLRKSGNTYAGIGHVSMSIYTPFRHLQVKLAKEKPADHISINGRTLLDVVSERILLGEDEE